MAIVHHHSLVKEVSASTYFIHVYTVLTNVTPRDRSGNDYLKKDETTFAKEKC